MCHGVGGSDRETGQQIAGQLAGPQRNGGSVLSARPAAVVLRGEEEARSAVLALGSEGIDPANLSALFGEALERELERLRKKHNAGEPFPLYKARLPGGRPRKG